MSDSIPCWPDIPVLEPIKVKVILPRTHSKPEIAEQIVSVSKIILELREEINSHPEILPWTNLSLERAMERLKELHAQYEGAV